MEGVGARIVTLDTSAISTSSDTSIVVSSSSSNFLVFSVMLVSLCSIDPLNEALEVGA